VRSAFDGLVAYCGTYEVNENDGYIIHYVQMDRVPNAGGHRSQALLHDIWKQACASSVASTGRYQRLDPRV
jgi:hypothetical protein